ncbi:MAG: NAD-glutamate dehydrogenase [Moraxellaceae bacterium]|nr:NAD-glutamate dehydrogenase [Moraxellaceae bacterium]
MNTQLKLSIERLDNITKIAQNFIHNNIDLLHDFMPIYYANLYQETASEYSDEDLAGMALHHFVMLKNYQLNQPVIKAFNPIVEEHHFRSPHSIIQLVAFDRPFLVDTFLMTLEGVGINIHRIYNTILDVERDEFGQVKAIKTVDSSDNNHISLIHFEIDRQDESKLEQVQQLFDEKVQTLDIVAEDWAIMRETLKDIKAEISTKPLTGDYYAENVEAFLEWILDEHFIFLGFREYQLEKTEDDFDLFTVDGSGLGILREEREHQISSSFSQLPTHLKKLLIEPRVLLLSKSSHVSPIHRPVYMDFLGIHKLNEHGEVIGEYRFVGLLTAQAYQLSVQQIPLLREKSDKLLAMSKLPVKGHAYKKLANIINELPRDDLFQAPVEEIYPIVSGIAQLQDKKRLRLFTRIDHYERFVSCLVYVPNEKFNTNLRIKIREHLQKAFNGTSSEFSTQFNESHHARLHVHVRTEAGQIGKVDIAKLEKELADITQGWTDEFTTALNTDVGEQQSNALLSQYGKAIPASYQEEFDVRTAVEDIKRLASLNEEKPMIWHLYQCTGDDNKQLHLKIYGQNTPANLSSVLPVLENFGVSVVTAQTYEFNLDNKEQWLQEYLLTLKNNQQIDLSVVRSQFVDSLKEIWNDKVESDKLNELILTTSLNTYDVVILRALSKYMLQAKAPFSIDYIKQTLIHHKAIAVKLVELFHARMDLQAISASERLAKVQAIQADIEEQLKAVNSLDEDRIIHWLLELINAVLRTNFYQVDENGERKDRLSFKFKASKISGLPQPKPMFEIYVYSPRVEAVHLRGGKVARGGLRWSDRMEDFRTEVLGLVKAQMVKNSVIVPVGSKGGFIVKKDKTDMDREAWFNEGVACYQTFIRGMLDITDNIINGEVIPPTNTTRHDEDDPYLVVAADKGTATFSDIANNLAREYGFWLDDAFASGGSVGYDHKAMGITAKGAWESVKRHFRLMGKDIQTKDDFTVVGIGDMSGDVFGNGMLLSRHIKLLSAFNHLHIFIDPTPDTEISFVERERLFNLPRSTWADYNSELISKGGGVFSRSDKSIAISEEMKTAFNITADSLTPDELIHEMLKAPVDLIWNGGIGTYVKASTETHSDVGDKANDSLRVNGCDVQAKLIGEGGNLGCTQKGRIEYAENGGRIYTDAIDNSGGVNCSDHEVNIKILLGAVVAEGDMTVKQRNQLLESMTDEVAELVLRQNYLQPQTIELSAYEAVVRLNEHQRMMQLLEKDGRLDRVIELLPTDEQIAERQKAGKGLTNPEFAVLLSYAKMWVFDNLLESDLPDEVCFQNELRKYFPNALDNPYFEQMTKHRLSREIISTYLTNGMVNRLGIETIFQLVEETGQDVATITRAYAIARDVFDVYQPWKLLEDLDNQVDAKLQIELELNLRKALKQAIAWFINNKGATGFDVCQLAEQYKASVQAILANEILLTTYFKETLATATANYQQQGLTSEQAHEFAKLATYGYALEVVQLASLANKSVEEVAEIYFSLQEVLNVAWFTAQTEQLPQQSYWDRRANNAISYELNRTLRTLTADILTAENGKQALENWLAQQQTALNKLQSAKESMQEEPAKLSALSVLLSEINGLVGK